MEARRHFAILHLFHSNSVEQQLSCLQTAMVAHWLLVGAIKACQERVKALGGSENVRHGPKKRS